MIQILFSIQIYLTQLFEQITFFVFAFPTKRSTVLFVDIYWGFWHSTSSFDNRRLGVKNTSSDREKCTHTFWIKHFYLTYHSCIHMHWNKDYMNFFKSKKSPMQKKVTTINYILLWTYKNHNIDGQPCMTFILQKVLSLKYWKRHAFLVFF